ncbi:hypothetical protein V501_03442 [Pseudogymnoascus sp. VKM F-4519 (FW-2642)]|nr:hypothetical protein V501_03442 [Pseudogymnoascus sp. VKM F-4519 (FW-2642)]
MKISASFVAAGLVVLANAKANPDPNPGSAGVGVGVGVGVNVGGLGGLLGGIIGGIGGLLGLGGNHGGGGGGGGNPEPPCTTSTTKKPTTTTAAPTSTATSCVNLGCYADPIGLPSRVLTFNSQINEGAQTPESCRAICLAAGLKYAGLEYSFECWCGDVLHNVSPPVIDASKCTFPCSGDSSKTCGGQEYLDLWDCSAAIPTPPDVNDCKPLGCYTDSTSGRTLQTSVEGGDANQSHETCTAACIALGFRFAGTEYGQECWCADSLASTGVPAPDGNEQCDMPCAGNPSQKCGGKDRINVYDCQYPTPSGTAPPVITVAPTSPPCPPRLVFDFHGCFGNRKTDSLAFCYDWLKVKQVNAITTTTTIKNRWAARSLGDKGPFGNYGGRLGNSRCQTYLPKWPKLKDFQDDEIERACRCHVGQWWQAPVVTKTVFH